eukprot:g28462.t1
MAREKAQVLKQKLDGKSTGSGDAEQVASISKDPREQRALEEEKAAAERREREAWQNHVFTFGPIYSFGVFLPIMKADLGISLTEASAISSTMNTAQFVGSLLAGLVIPQRLGHASVAFFGAVAVLIGLALLSMVESVYHAYPAVILAGLGLGSSNLAGLVALNATVPPRKRAMLVGFATCGTSVGTILLPQFYTLLSGQHAFNERDRCHFSHLSYRSSCG